MDSRRVQRRSASVITPLPTLDTLAAAPEQARGLDRETLFLCFLRAQSLATICAMAMMTAAPGGGEEDRVMTVTETARLLGVAESTLTHDTKGRYKPLAVHQGRRLGFSARKVQEFIRRKTGT